MKNTIFSIPIGAVALLMLSEAMAQEVNLYSARQPFLMKPLLKAFTGKTGIKVNMV